MPHRDDQDHGATARDVITNCLIEVAKDRGYIHPFHRQAEYILAALTEAGYAIVEAGQVCFDKDEAIRLMTLAAGTPGEGE